MNCHYCIVFVNTLVAQPSIAYAETLAKAVRLARSGVEQGAYHYAKVYPLRSKDELFDTREE